MDPSISHRLTLVIYITVRGQEKYKTISNILFLNSLKYIRIRYNILSIALMFDLMFIKLLINTRENTGLTRVKPRDLWLTIVGFHSSQFLCFLFFVLESYRFRVYH